MGNRKDDYSYRSDYSARSNYSPPRYATTNYDYPPPPHDRRSPPPSKSGYYDRYQTPSSAPWQQRQNREREGEWEGGGRRQSEVNDLKRLFEGFAFYVHLGIGMNQVGEARELQELIRDHGGRLCKEPNSHLVTHIIISSHLLFPFFLLDKHDEGETPRYGEWNRNRIIRHLSRVISAPSDSRLVDRVGERQEQERSGRRYVLRKEWVEECISNRRVINSRDDFGGWEVKGTYDLKLANNRNVFARIIPSNELRQSKQIREEPLPQDPRKVQRGNKQNGSSGPSSDFKMAEKATIDNPSNNTASPEIPAIEDNPVMALQSEAPKSDSVLQAENSSPRQASLEPKDTSVESIGKDREDVGTMDIKPILRVSICEDSLESEIPQDAEASRDHTPTTPPIPRSSLESRPTGFGEESEISLAIPNESTAKESLLSSPPRSQSRSILNANLTASPTPMNFGQDEKKIFARGCLPLTFHVVGSDREKVFTEILISDRGGIITPSTYATITIIPISPDKPIDPQSPIKEIVRDLQDQPGRIALSADWIEHCVKQDKLLPFEKHVIQLESETIDIPTPSPSSTRSEGHRRSLSVSREYEGGDHPKRSKFPASSI